MAAVLLQLQRLRGLALQLATLRFLAFRTNLFFIVLSAPRQ